MDPLYYSTYLGDNKTLTIPLTWEGEPFTPGASWAGIFTAKFQATDVDAKAAFQHASGGNLSFVDSNAIVLLDPADTEDLTPVVLIIGIRMQHVITGEKRTMPLGRLGLLRPPSTEFTTTVPPNNTSTPMPFGLPLTITAGDELEIVSGGVTYYLPLYRRP